MCHVLNDAVASIPSTDRRRLLSMVGLGAVGAVTASALRTPAAAAAPTTARRPDARTRVVLLGTAGGPAVLDGGRHGVSTAIAFEDKVNWMTVVKR